MAASSTDVKGRFLTEVQNNIDYCVRLLSSDTVEAGVTSNVLERTDYDVLFISPEVNDMDGTNLDEVAFLEMMTKWLVLSLDWDCSYMIPIYAPKLTNVAVIESRHTYPYLCTDNATLLYHLKHHSNDIHEDVFRAMAINLIAQVYFSYNHRIRTLIYTELGREMTDISWSDKENGMIIESEIFPNTKYGFNKKEILVSMLEWEPFTVKEKDGNYTGFTMVILDRLAFKLNFTYRVVEPADGQWGIEKNGSWTGMVGLLQNRKVDLVATALSVSHDREGVLDFLYPIYFDTTRLVLKQPDENEEKWRTLIDIYQEDVLIYIGASLVFATVSLCLVERINPFFSLEENRNRSRLRSFSDCFWYNYGALLTQGGTNTPDDQSGRAVLSYWWIFCIVSMAIYSANLMAFLTVPKPKLPFESMEEMVEQKKYKWGLYGNGAMQSLFSESTLDIHRKVWSKLVEFNQTDSSVLSSSEKNHYDKVLNGHYVYFAANVITEYYQAKGIDIDILPEVISVMPYAFAVQNGSPYEKIFSREIMKMHEHGLLDLWIKISFHTTHSKPTVLIAKQISMEDLQSAFYLIGIGVAIGIIIWIVEGILYKMKRCSRQTKASVTLNSYDTTSIDSID